MTERRERVRECNYYVVQAFMVKRLGLKGLELACYAIIYGFSQAEGQSFSGSLQYLAEWTGASKQAIITALSKLVEKGYLDKKEELVNRVKSVRYSITLTSLLADARNILDGGGKETCIPLVKGLDGGGKETCPNKIEDNLGDNIEDKRKNNKIGGEFDSNEDFYEAVNETAELAKDLFSPKRRFH